MSRLYLSCKLRAKRFILDYLKMFLQAQLSSAFIFAVFYYSTRESHLRSSDGKTVDMYFYGIVAVWCCVGLNHIQISSYINEWNIFYTPIFVLSFCFTPFNYWLVTNTASAYIHQPYPEVILQPLFLCQILLVLGTCGLLMHFFRRVYTLVVIKEFNI